MMETAGQQKVITMNAIETLLKVWSEQDALVESHQADIQSANDVKIDAVAQVSMVETWSAESLSNSDGAARAVVTEALKRHTGTEPVKGTVSKWCTWAHPKIRGHLPQLRETAAVERLRVLELFDDPKKQLPRDDVLYKMAKHLKSKADVTTVEQACAAAHAEYIEQKEKAANRPDPKSFEGTKAALTTLSKRAAKVCTPASHAALVAAIDGLAPLVVEAPVPEAAEAPVLNDDVAAVLARFEPGELAAIAALLKK